MRLVLLLPVLGILLTACGADTKVENVNADKPGETRKVEGRTREGESGAR